MHIEGVYGMGVFIYNSRSESTFLKIKRLAILSMIIIRRGVY